MTNYNYDTSRVADTIPKTQKQDFAKNQYKHSVPNF